MSSFSMQSGVIEDGRRHVHEALFYKSPDDLVTRVAPFLIDGLEAGDDVVLACTEDNNRAVAQALGRDRRVVVLPRPEVFEKAVTALEFFRELTQSRVRAGARQVRVVCQVGASSGRGSECRRFEALSNHVLSSLPLWRVCAYDVGALPVDVVAAAEATHPYLRRSGASAANPAYVEPAELLRLPDPDMAPLPEREPDLELHDVHVHDLRGLARRVEKILDAARLESERTDDLLLVLNEVATNGLRHGEPPVTVRLWAGSERIDCTVTDQGTGIDDPLAGYLPGGGEALPEGRFGLWLARRLCDDLVTTRSPKGFTVRLVLNR